MQNRQTLWQSFASAGRLSVWVALFSFAVSLGCSDSPSRVHPPSIDADDAAALAMETYDTDGDGFVAGQELENAPGLRAAITTLDSDGDGKVSGEEVKQRILVWQGTKIGIMPIACNVFMNGKPLAGSTVTFEPEKFLGENIKTALGDSGPMGDCYPTIPKENRPTPETGDGIQFGLFLVRISRVVNGQETIPKRYNVETTLAQEISNDDPAMQRHRIEFRMKSK